MDCSRISGLLPSIEAPTRKSAQIIDAVAAVTECASKSKSRSGLLRLCPERRRDPLDQLATTNAKHRCDVEGAKTKQHREVATLRNSRRHY